MTYMITEADVAAAEKHEQDIRDKAVSFGHSAIASWMPRDSFLEGVKHAKASASPAPEEWEMIGEEEAKRYARELGGFPRGTALISVNGHTRGWQDCARLIAEPLLAENKWLKGQLEIMDGNAVDDERTIDEHVEDHDTMVAELTSLRAELKEWEELEAACCPEGVGFPEHIEAALTRAERAEEERDTLKAELERARAENAAMRGVAEVLKEGRAILSSALFELNQARIDLKSKSIYGDALCALDTNHANETMERFNSLLAKLQGAGEKNG